MQEHPWFFENWNAFGRLAVVGILGYVAFVAVLRLTGKKSLAQMNVFDSVFVIALGDVLATGIMDKTTPLFEMVFALGVLIGLRLILQTAAKKSDRFEEFLNGSPVLVYRDGKFLETVMKKDDVTREEILMAMRQKEAYSIDEVEAVVLETDGSFSVVKREEHKGHSVPADRSTLADVKHAKENATAKGRSLHKEHGSRSSGAQTLGILIPLLVMTGASGCTPAGSRYVVDKDPSYARDSVETSARLVGVVQGFYQPESVRYDAEQDVFFVSNVLGEGSAKDGNGYIVKVDASDFTKSSIFAAGGKNGVTLDAPKGMALQGDTLWVADIDVLRGFDRHTGKSLANIDFKPMKAVLLNDAGIGPDGIYISDTGILMTDKGVIRVGGDRIFRVGPGRAIQIVAAGDSLGRPNGVTWDATTKRWLVVSFDPWRSEMYALRPSDSLRTVLATGSGKWDGIEMLSTGAALVTSWSDSSVHLLSGRSDVQVIRGVSTPADLGIDTKRGVIAVPQIFRGRVEFWRL